MTTTTIVLIWVIISALGLLLGLFSIWDDSRDLSSLGGLTNGRLTVAKAMLTMDATRVVIKTIFVLIGASVLLNWPMPFRGIFFSIGLVFVNILLLFNSITQLRMRWALREAVKNAELAE